MSTVRKAESQGKFESSNISTVRDHKDLEETADMQGLEMYENTLCGRFPHMKYCMCVPSCLEAVPAASITEVYDKIFIGPIQAAYKLKELLESKITHVLNVSCQYYTKRPKLLYLDVDVHDSLSEDVKRHFRITNRFIDEGRKLGNVLVHCTDGHSRASTFVLAYLIAKQKVKLKNGILAIRSKLPEIQPNENFMQQLTEYDLEQLAKLS